MPLYMFTFHILPLHWVLSAPWCSHLRKDELELVQIQRRAINTIKNVACLSYEERLSKLELLNLQEMT